MQMPAVVALGATSFTDATLAARIHTDFSNTLGKLYETEHLQPISQWAKSFEYTYRAQARGVTGVDQFSSAAIVDIPEGDNGTKGDGIRQLAGAARMEDKAYVSMEAVTGFGNLMLNWADVLTEVTQNFSHGVNHVILHGSPYNKTWNGYMSNWSGWQAFGNNFAESYTYRQIYWEDVASLSGYMARNQAVLRNGVAKVDLAVIGNGSGNSFQNLLDNGYSYHVASEAMLNLKSATVSNGRLYENGPAYKAMIVVGSLNDGAGGTDNTDPMGGPEGLAQGMSAGAPDGGSVGPASVAASFEEEPPRSYRVALIKKLQSLAESGLPVVLLNMTAKSVSGTEAGDNTDAALVAALEQLKATKNVVQTSTRADVLAALKRLLIKPAASYDQVALEATHYVDKLDGSDYFYLYNNTNPRNGGMLNVGQNLRYKTGKAVTTDVVLTGIGIPYQLNAWTGEIRPIAQYHVNQDGTVSTRINLHGGESTIVALLNKNVGKAAAGVVEASGAEAIYRDGSMWLRSKIAGEHTVVLADGNKKTVLFGETPTLLDLGMAKWNLELQSFGPDYTNANKQGKIVTEFDTPYAMYKDPSASTKTTINFQNISLGSWSDLPATKQQLATLGVKSMLNVSGIGRYTTSFDLPPDWSNDTGAVLKLGYGQDQVTEVVINGKSLKGFNVIADEVDLGGYLQPGKNNLTIKLDTSLFNRAVVESLVFKLPGRQINGNKPVGYGLKSATLTPYTEKPL
ncbi:MAG: hypothetical protein QM808_04125 [Steroidobacteraceae bacterium]